MVLRISDQEGCGQIRVYKEFGIPKFLAVGVQADRLKPARDDFKSVYFIIERRGGREILQVGTVE